MFQMCFMDPNQGSASASTSPKQGLGTKIAIICKNDDVYSMGIYDTFMEKAWSWAWRLSSRPPSPTARTPISPCS